MSQLDTPRISLRSEPLTEIGHEHPAGQPTIEIASWGMKDWGHSNSVYRSPEQVTARFGRARWRAAITWALGPSFSLASTVVKAVLTDKHLYLAFLDGRRARAPITAIWGRIELEPRLRRSDVFQIGPSFWIYFPPGPPRDLVDALDRFPLREHEPEIPDLNPTVHLR